MYQEIMRNKNLSVEAKAIYAYLSSIAGVDGICYPSIDTIQSDLSISKGRLSKYMNELTSSGVVEKVREKCGNLYGKNVYKVTHKNEVAEDLKSIFREVENREVESREVENLTTNNNNTNINNINNNKVDYQLIADMYNNTCVSFPKLTKLSEKRKKAIKARLNTYTIDDFKKLFEMAESSSFLKGQNNRNWIATFDWIIQDANAAKILDGNYADKPKTQGKESVGYESASSIKLWE